MTTQIAEYSKTEATLAKFREAYKDKTYAVKTRDGMADAKSVRKEIKDERVWLESERKRIKAPALQRARDIDSEATRIKDELKALEDPIDAQIKGEEGRKKREKEEAAKVELARVEGIRFRISEIERWPLGMVGCKADKIADAVKALVAMPIEEEDFAERLEEARAVHTESLRKVRELHESAVTVEEQAAEIKAKEAEIERAQAEQEARDKAAAEKEAAESKARAEAEAESRRKIEEEKREARERIEAEEKAAKEKREKADAELERRLKEQAAQAAEERRKIEDEARASREKIEADERAARERKEAAEREERKAQEEEEAKAKAEQLAKDEAERKELQRIEDEDRAAAAAERARQDAIEAKAKAARDAEEEAARKARQARQERADMRTALALIIELYGDVEEIAPVVAAIRALPDAD